MDVPRDDKNTHTMEMCHLIHAIYQPYSVGLQRANPFWNAPDVNVCLEVESAKYIPLNMLCYVLYFRDIFLAIVGRGCEGLVVSVMDMEDLPTLIWKPPGYPYDSHYGAHMEVILEPIRSSSGVHLDVITEFICKPSWCPSTSHPVAHMKFIWKPSWISS